MTGTTSEQLAEEIVSIFGMLDTTADEEGFGSERDNFASDLRGLTRSELIIGLAETERFLRAVHELAQEVLDHDVVTTMALRDALRRTEAALATVTRTIE